MSQVLFYLPLLIAIISVSIVFVVFIKWKNILYATLSLIILISGVIASCVFKAVHVFHLYDNVLHIVSFFLFLYILFLIIASIFSFKQLPVKRSFKIFLFTFICAGFIIQPALFNIDLFVIRPIQEKKYAKEFEEREELIKAINTEFMEAYIDHENKLKDQKEIRSENIKLQNENKYYKGTINGFAEFTFKIPEKFYLISEFVPCKNSKYTEEKCRELILTGGDLSSSLGDVGDKIIFFKTLTTETLINNQRIAFADDKGNIIAINFWMDWIYRLTQEEKNYSLSEKVNRAEIKIEIPAGKSTDIMVYQDFLRGDYIGLKSSNEQDKISSVWLDLKKYANTIDEYGEWSPRIFSINLFYKDGYDESAYNSMEEMIESFEIKEYL